MDFAGFEELIAGFGTGDKNTALEVRTLFTHLIQSIFLPGDIKEVWCTQDDIDNDYDETGLGIGKRLGWALCNGLNGTPPKGGRVSIGISDEYDIGDTGGFKKHKLLINELPKFKVKFKGSVNTTGGSGTYVVNNTNNTGGDIESIEIGGDVAHENMQPYIALVSIMKK